MVSAVPLQQRTAPRVCVRCRIEAWGRETACSPLLAGGKAPQTAELKIMIFIKEEKGARSMRRRVRGIARWPGLFSFPRNKREKVRIQWYAK